MAQVYVLVLIASNLLLLLIPFLFVILCDAWLPCANYYDVVESTRANVKKTSAFITALPWCFTIQKKKKLGMAHLHTYRKFEKKIVTIGQKGGQE